jgi:lipopolysaccharide export system permease protein
VAEALMRLGLLDRYVLRTWIRIFALTGLGFPVVSILIQITDNIRRLLGRGLTLSQIFVSYCYALPAEIAEVMPASVFFATVFTLGAMSRHAEVVAAQAGGRSFYRLAMPIFGAAAVTTVLAFVVGEISVDATARALEHQQAREARPTTLRSNFVYRGDGNWVYTVRSLDVVHRVLRQPVFLRQGNDADRMKTPDLAVSADSATYDTTAGAWRLWGGTSRIIYGDKNQPVFEAGQLRLRALSQSPTDLLAESKPPADMRYPELGRYITALRRSGNDVNKLEVDRTLKIAIPVTCLIIALFGAPLSLSSPRAGPAFGIAISLATTVLFLLVINLSKAVGEGGVVNPVLAAWLPNIVFGGAALVLLRRART